MPDPYLSFQAKGFSARSLSMPGSPKRGIEAWKGSINGDPSTPKKVYYLEGSHYEMGYQLGLLAEPTIARMTTRFVHRMIWDLIVWHPRQSTDPDPNAADLVNRVKNFIGGELGDLMRAGCLAMERDIPSEYVEELRGIQDGCRAANPNTLVTPDDLRVLNLGIDWFMANVYTGFGLFEGLARAVRDWLAGIHLPGACNGFALLNGAAADNGRLFGRDFMFPTGGVFEYTACPIIYKPDPVAGRARHPFVSLTAPGLIGSICGVNDSGVAIGVDIAPSAAADPSRPGFNSLLLNRYCIEMGDSAAAAADVIVQARRGVPWIYIIADGSGNGAACVVEAAKYSDQDIDFLSVPPKSLKSRCLCRRPYLPGRSFLGAHPTARQQNGAMIRWEDYSYDQAYLDFNPRLFRRFGRVLYPGAHERMGFINGTYSEKNCPYWYYFAPQREMTGNVVLTTNHFIIPEMRYTAMTPWLAFLFGKLAQDSQWRYDALNTLILDALDQAGPAGIAKAKAREILQFLDPTPAGTYRGYYGTGKKVIEGSQSLIDLKDKIMESHYGFYADDWIELKLGDYLP